MSERDDYHEQYESNRRRSMVANLLKDLQAEYRFDIGDPARTLTNWLEQFGAVDQDTITKAKSRLFMTYEAYGKFPTMKHFQEAIDWALSPHNSDHVQRVDAWNKSVMFQQALLGRVTEDALLRMEYIQAEYPQDGLR